MELDARESLVLKHPHSAVLADAFLGGTDELGPAVGRPPPS